MFTWSYWEQDSFLKNIDLCIIGGGIVGLNAALNAKKISPKSKVVIIDRGVLPLGASTKNAGFACFGSVSELLDDLKNLSQAEVFALVKMRWEGLKLLKEIIGERNMQFEQYGGYEIFSHQESAVFEKCNAAIPEFNRLLADITGEQNVYQSLSAQKAAYFGFENINHLILNRLEGQIHTGKTIQALLNKVQKAGVICLNGMNVTQLQENGNKVTITSHHVPEIVASKVLVCTNGFTHQLYPNLDVQPARNQVILTESIPNLKLKGTFHYQEGYYYFRNIGKDRILLGGGRHLAKKEEETSEFGFTDTIQNALLDLLQHTIAPKHPIKIAQKWSGIMGVGAIKKPIIEMHSHRIGVAVRMGGMGVAIGSLVGKQGAEMMLQ